MVFNIALLHNYLLCPHSYKKSTVLPGIKMHRYSYGAAAYCQTHFSPIFFTSISLHQYTRHAHSTLRAIRV